MNENRERAQQMIINALKAQTHTWTAVDGMFDPLVLKRDLGEELAKFYFTRLHEDVDHMLSVAKDIKQYAERMKRDMDDAVKYVSGEPSSFNNLGVLQSSAPRFDGLCMMFPKAVDHAVRTVTDVLNDLSAVGNEQPHLRD